MMEKRLKKGDVIIYEGEEHIFEKYIKCGYQGEDWNHCLICFGVTQTNKTKSCMYSGDKPLFEIIKTKKPSKTYTQELRENMWNIPHNNQYVLLSEKDVDTIIKRVLRLNKKWGFK